jgi:cellulose synthase/poly-beta-1,6-N-acetylglucosamine synthase-like glycosyltransferase
VFLTFDADVVLGSYDVIEKLISCFRDSKVALASGLDTPFAPQNRFERIVTTWLKVWYYTRKNLNGGDSVHNHHGCVSAIIGDFARNLEIPKEIYSDDDYLYFSTIKNGYKFFFVSDAKVLYRAPNNIRDYFLQFTRLLTLKNRVADYFGNWVYAYYKVPASYKTRGLLTVFIQDPIYLTLAVFFQVALRLFKGKFNDKFKSGVSWETATSTRVLPKNLKGAF